MIDFTYKIVIAEPERDLLVCEFSAPGQPTIPHRVSIAPQDEWTEENITARIYNTIPLVEAEWKNIALRATQQQRSASPFLGREGAGTWVDNPIDVRPPDHHPINEKVVKDKSKVHTNMTPREEIFSVVPTTEEEKAEKRANFRLGARLSMRQARLLLAREGKLGQINAAIKAAGEEAEIEWQYAHSVQRNSALAVAMARVLGWTEEELDEKFISARDI